MSLDEIYQEIIGGIAEGERPADAIYICQSVAVARLAHDEDTAPSEYGFDPPIYRRRSPRDPEPRFGFGSRFGRLLRRSGIILCPIFEPIKHEEYREYSDKMTTTRLQYSGIATNPQMRMIFAERVEYAIEIGAFRSLEAAKVRDLPSIMSNGDIPKLDPELL